MSRIVVFAQKVLAACVGAACVAGGADSALADTNNAVTPGSVCRATPSNEDVAASSHGWLVNGTTSDGKYVNCPIVRDMTSGDFSSLFVRILDSNLTSFLPYCVATSLNNSGSHYDSTPVTYHSNPGGQQSLSLNVSGFTLTTNGSVSITCVLGRNDTILNIRQVEQP